MLDRGKLYNSRAFTWNHWKEYRKLWHWFENVARGTNLSNLLSMGDTDTTHYGIDILFSPFCVA